MQSFLGGDKGGSSNPLKQISGREGTDRSVFRDRHAPAGPQSSSQHAFNAPQAQQSNQQLVHAQTPHPFNLSHLSSALSSSTGSSAQVRPPAHFDQTWSQRPVGPAPQRYADAGWSQGYSQSARPAGPSSDWANGFTAEGKGKGRAEPYMQQQQHQPQQAEHYDPYRSSLNMGMGMGMGGGMGMGMGYQPSFQPMYTGYQQQAPQAAARVQEMTDKEHAEMEAAFERAFEDAKVADPVEVGDQQETAPPEEEIREAKGEFDKVWESLKPEAERLGKLAEWEKEFSQFTNDEDDLFETLNDSITRSNIGQTSLDDQLEFGLGGDPTLVRPDLMGYLDHDDGVPTHQEYQFRESASSKYSDLSPAQALIVARAILQTGGSLTDASDLLETFLQRATLADRAEAGVGDVEVWTLLGRTHAMNEKEEKALAAFAQGRAAIENSGGTVQPMTGELLTNLAISYVNESLDLAALTVLHQYLTLSAPQLAGPKPLRSNIASDAGPWVLHQSLTEQYLAVARHQYETKGEVDPDVQVGLGTLYYMMGEYGDARGCWVNALGERPDDYLLWNRLGATLANGGNPEEAVDAYRRALELRPTFTRAIFNLGVACLNIGVHREAAEHFLAALSLHDDKGDSPSGGNDSAALWATLRRAFAALDLNDLAAQAVPGADLQIFRAAGFDF